MSVVQKHVFVCQQQKPSTLANCNDKDGAAVLTAFKTSVYKANLEKDVLVTGCGCMGVCNFGPTVVVYPEGKWYTGVKVEDVQKIVDEHLAGGRAVQRENLDEAAIRAEQQSWHVKIRAKMQKEGLL